jgi:cytochrome P450
VTVLSQVFDDPNLPLCEKSSQRIQEEAQLVIGASLSTTAWAATVASYHILRNPEILRKLHKELFAIVPKGEKRADCTDLDWAALEALPYFQACIKEAIRLSYGMSSRSSHVTPHRIIYTEAKYFATGKTPKTWRIPANNPISMSSTVTSHDEFIFKNSQSFNPNRWLGPEKPPDKHFITFRKGSRTCLGMQLAWAELNLLLASVFRWFEMELHDTDERCVNTYIDVGVPVPTRDDGVGAYLGRDLD